MWEALSSLGSGVGDWFSGLGSSFANFFSPEAYGQTLGTMGGGGGISDVVRGSSVGGDPTALGTSPFQGLSADYQASMGGGGNFGLGSLGDIFKTGAGLASVGGSIGGILGGSRSPRLDRQQGPEGAAQGPIGQTSVSPETQPLGAPQDPTQARLTAANLQSQGVGEGAVNTDFIKQYLPPEFQSMTPEQLLNLIHQQGQ